MDDRVLLLEVLEAYERTLLEKKALEHLLDGTGIAWKEMRDELLQRPDAHASIHALFEPLYDSLRKELSLEQALADFSRVLPGQKKPD